MTTSPKVAVIGAGVIGASIAYRLACAGASVHVFEATDRPGSGVTGKAFGWVNLINGDPSNDRVFNLWRHGVEEYRLLEAEVPEAFEGARRGSLLWMSTAAKTENLGHDHMRVGHHAELIGRSHIARLEPNLSQVPDCAILSKDDIALSPMHLARTLIERATSMGAILHAATAVEAIASSGKRATGVVAGGEVHDADIVVVASGPNTEEIVSSLGVKLELETSPAVLLRYTTDKPVTNQIVCCPTVEARQADDLTIFCAIDYTGDASANSLQAAGAKELEALRETFTTVGNLKFLDASIGNRPMFKDGRPRVGAAAGIESLYIAVGHPGVILAPLIGRMAADEIIRGIRSPLLSLSELPNKAS